MKFTNLSKKPRRIWSGQIIQILFMRDFLYSEISQIEKILNISDDPALAIAASKVLFENLLETKGNCW